MQKNFFDELAADPKYGPKLANQLRSVVADPQFQGQIRVSDPTCDGEALQGAMKISAFFQARAQNPGQGPAASTGAAPGPTPPDIKDMPGALRQVLFGFAEALDFPSVVPTGKVPKEEGLPEACEELAEAKMEEPEKMLLCKADEDKLKHAAARINLVRGFIRPVARFTMGLNRARTTTEINAFTMLSNGYTPFRTSAQADDDLADRLENTENYLFGSAQQGAQTNKANQKLKAKVQTAADQQAMVGARRQINQGVMSDLMGLVQELQGSVSTTASTSSSNKT